MFNVKALLDFYGVRGVRAGVYFPGIPALDQGAETDHAVFGQSDGKRVPSRQVQVPEKKEACSPFPVLHSEPTYFNTKTTKFAL